MVPLAFKISRIARPWLANRWHVGRFNRKEPTCPHVLYGCFRQCLPDSSPTVSVTWTREVNSWGIVGECGLFPSTGGWTVSESRERGSIEGANVPQAGNAVSILHPLSLRLLAYFYSSLSETWVGSSPFPLEEFFLRLAPPPLPPPLPPPSRHSTFSPPGTDAVTTTCKHSGICNSNAAKRGRKAATEQPEAVRLTSRRGSRTNSAILLTVQISVVAEIATVYWQIFKQQSTTSIRKQHSSVIYLYAIISQLF
jgi:hypothetical protein